MKAFPWKCATCHERAVKQVVLPSYSAKLEHDGRKYEITLNDFTVLQCEKCAAIVLDDAAEDRLTDGLRSTAGLLTPAEIRKHREAFGLTQKALANLLAISESTLSRWETGAQIQQRSMDRFLRCFFELTDVRRFLGAPETTLISDRERALQVSAPPR